MKSLVKNSKEFFQFIVEFLCEDEGITQEVIQKHWNPESNKPNDLSRIFQRLTESAQNMQMAPNVVSGLIGGIEKLKRVTNYFDVKYVSNNYAKADHLKLLETIENTFNIKTRKTKRSIWPRFCKSIIDGAYFLEKFGTAENFYEYADGLYSQKKTKNLLPIALTLEIRGYGIALACDFLKEIGFVNYGKPDVHLQDILIASGYLDPSMRNKTEGIYQIMSIIDEIAEEANLTAYAVDKTIWLVGSGNYYKSGIKTRNRKKEFIERIQSI